MWRAQVALGAFVLVANAAGAEEAAPRVLYSDILSGPNRGGENDKGIYLSVFGKNFGDAAGLGKRTKVRIGGVEAGSYRYLGPSRGRQDIQQLTVQIGALGDAKPGLPLPIEVEVDGRTSNRDHSFAINPGTIYFVSLSGSDIRGDGSFERPYRTVQNATVNNNGIEGCPASAANQSVTTVGVWGLVQPGDFIVMRGGEWTDVSKDGFFLRVQNKSGTAPSGEAGSGPITVMGYPGDDVFINRRTSEDNQRGGAISSADIARQRLGCGARIVLTNLRIESGFNEGMVNVQNGTLNPSGSHWRVVNNEMTALSCRHNTKCRGGGASGAGVGNYWVGNYVHDVHDKPDSLTSFENHGFYMEGPGSYEIAYNRIENIVGGNGIQGYSASTTINDARIHHNLIKGVGKHGINIANGSERAILIFNNIVWGADVAALRFGTTRLTGAKVYNNTFVDSDRLNAGGSRAAVMNDEKLAPGALEIRNNIIVPGAPGRKLLGGAVGFGAVTMSNNLGYGSGAPALAGSANVAADPRFADVAAGDFRLGRGSPGIDSGSPVVAPVVEDDFDAVMRRPLGSGFDVGAFEHGS